MTEPNVMHVENIDHLMKLDSRVGKIETRVALIEQRLEDGVTVMIWIGGIVSALLVALLVRRYMP